MKNAKVQLFVNIVKGESMMNEVDEAHYIKFQKWMQEKDIDPYKELDKLEQKNKDLNLGINLEKMKERVYIWCTEYSKDNYINTLYKVLKNTVKRYVKKICIDEYNKALSNIKNNEVLKIASNFDVDAWGNDCVERLFYNWGNDYITRDNLETEAMLKIGDFCIEVQNKEKNNERTTQVL